MERVTLEVAVSNRAAQRLYAKYGFDVVGRRKAYYSDTGEDALIMTTPPLQGAVWRQRYRRVSWRRSG
jgi:ribosomal-protein-alanine N-acetyltransferase